MCGSAERAIRRSDREIAREATALFLIAEHAVILMLLLMAFVMYRIVRPDPGSLIYPACWLGLAVILWAFWSWKQVTGTWFDPYTLFLMSTGLFHGGQAFLELLHLNEDGILGGQFPDQTTLHSLFLVTLGTAAMHLGALVSAARRRGSQRRPASGTWEGTESLRQVGWLLLALSIVPMVMLVGRGLSIVLEEGYFALYQQAAGTGFLAGARIMAGFFVPASLFLLAGGRGSRMAVGLSGLLIIAHSAIAMFMGVRSGALAPLIAYGWVWHRCRKPLSAKVLLGTGMTMLLLILPLIGSIRDAAGTERSSLSSLFEAASSLGNPMVQILSEMGGSLATLAHTIDLVPSSRPFSYGAEYLHAALTIVPNVFGEVHPSIARGTPAAWLVTTVDPDFAALGGGFGYSFMAEAFLNFGSLGVPVVLFTIGLLYGRFVTWGAWSSDPLKIATLASYLAFFLVYARSDATSVVRPLIWYTLLPYLLVLLSQRYRKDSP